MIWANYVVGSQSLREAMVVIGLTFACEKSRLVEKNYQIGSLTSRFRSCVSNYFKLLCLIILFYSLNFITRTPLADMLERFHG